MPSRLWWLGGSTLESLFLDLGLHDGRKEENKKNERLGMTVYLIGVESPAFPCLHYVKVVGGMVPALGFTGKLCDVERRKEFRTFNLREKAQSYVDDFEGMAKLAGVMSIGWKYFVVPMEYEEEGKES